MESQVVCALIQQVKTQENLTTPFEIFGVSYGGLLSAATAAHCSKNIARVTAFNPPISLLKTLDIIDKIAQPIKSHPQQFQKISRASNSSLFVLAKLGFHEHYRNLFIKFFLKGMGYSIQSYYRYSSQKKSLKEKKVAGFKYNSSEYLNWEAQLNFRHFFIEGRETSLSKIEHGLNIQHWLDLLDKKKVPFYIVSSKDDPINPPESLSLIHISEPTRPY